MLWHSFELHRQVDAIQLVNAIQMGTHHIYLYKDVDKTYTGCNLKTMKLLDCALIGVCAVRYIFSQRNKTYIIWIPHLSRTLLAYKDDSV